MRRNMFVKIHELRQQLCSLLDGHLMLMQDH